MFVYQTSLYMTEAERAAFKKLLKKGKTGIDLEPGLASQLHISRPVIDFEQTAYKKQGYGHVDTENIVIEHPLAEKLKHEPTLKDYEELENEQMAKYLAVKNKIDAMPQANHMADANGRPLQHW